MKFTYLFVILLVLAWPFYYLYELQLGAIPFLLLAIFFLVVSVKEVKKFKKQNEPTSIAPKKKNLNENKRNN